MSDRRVYLGDLPPRPRAWREGMMFIAGALTVLLMIIAMQTVFRWAPGSTVCTKYLWYEVVVKRY